MIESRRAQYVMGTIVEMVARADAREQADAGLELAFREIERVEQICSRFNPESELSRLNERASDGPVSVSSDLYRIIADAIRFARLSRGCFSIALAPLSDLWSASASRGDLPGRSEIDATLERCRMADVLCEGDDRSIAFARSGIRLDLGGFAKGYAVDRASDALRSVGVEHGFISAGQSSIFAFGIGEGGPWRVGVRHPGDEERIVAELELADVAVSTTGTYERSTAVAGRHLSHVVDPRNGLPVEGLAGATVTCASAGLAEVVSKMVLLLGCTDAILACDANGWDVEGLFVRADGVSTHASLEWSDRMPIRVCNEREHDAISTL